MNLNILLIIIMFLCGELLFEIPSLLRQIYVEKHIKEKHSIYSKSKWMMTRKYCAFYGYDLDRLQYDKRWEVRIEVARRGYNIQNFLKDKNRLVRQEAYNYLQRLT